MTIRPARSVDASELVDILVERHADTRFAGHVDIDPVYARRLIAQAVQRHGHTTEGACWAEVSEVDGKIEGFMLGTLARVYLVGDRLVAQDLFLVGRKDCNPRAMLRLLDGYIGWAAGNPKVFEIALSWTDILPSGERFDPLYRAKGFIPCGGIYRRDAVIAAKEAA